MREAAAAGTIPSAVSKTARDSRSRGQWRHGAPVVRQAARSALCSR